MEVGQQFSLTRERVRQIEANRTKPPRFPPTPISATLPRAHAGGHSIDRFSFFFAFYGLILGLAVTELLGGFARIVRAKALRQLEPQTVLLATLTFILICATWIDAWDSLRTITLDFSGLWAPILLATAYYLAAATVFPHDPREYPRLATYFAERKRFTVGMLLAAELLVTYSYAGVLIDWYVHKPAVFWLWEVPYNAAIKGSFVALLFVRGRRANLVFLAALILLFMIPYWDHHAVSTAIAQHYGY